MATTALEQKKSFTICSTYKEAWQNVKGMKGSYWGAMGLYFAMSLGLILCAEIIFAVPSFLIGMFTTVSHDPTTLSLTGTILMVLVGVIAAIVYFFIYAGLILPMILGLFLISTRKIKGKSISYAFIFKYIKKKYFKRMMAMSLFLLVIVLVFELVAGIFFTLSHSGHFPYIINILFWGLAVVAILGLIYVLVAYSLSFFMVLDQDMTAWQALETSRKTVAKHWFRMFFLLFFVTIINFIAMIPLFIGLIWALPWSKNVITVAYDRLYGIAGKDPVTLQEAA